MLDEYISTDQDDNIKYVPRKNACKKCGKPRVFPFCDDCAHDFRVWINQERRRMSQIEAACNDHNTGLTGLGVRFR